MRVRTLLVGALGLCVVPVHAQEPGAAGVDSADARDAQSDTLASPVDRARVLMRTLDAAADSIEALATTRLTDPDVDLHFLQTHEASEL